MNRPRYADVAATLALVLALGGTAAYAAQNLPKNSVGKKQLKPNSVNGKKVKNGSIKSVDLDAGSVTVAQLADSSVTSRKIANDGILAGDLAPGSVASGTIADGSVNLADLGGGRATTTVTYSNLLPGACQALSVAVPGSAPGQVGILSLTNNVDPQTVAFGPVRVTAGTVTSQICNVGNANVSATNLGIRVVTLG